MPDAFPLMVASLRNCVDRGPKIVKAAWCERLDLFAVEDRPGDESGPRAVVVGAVGGGGGVGGSEHPEADRWGGGAQRIASTRKKRTPKGALGLTPGAPGATLCHHGRALGQRFEAKKTTRSSRRPSRCV